MKKRWGFLLLAEMAVLFASILWSVNHFQKNRVELNFGQDDFQCLVGETDYGYYVDTSRNDFKDTRIGLSGVAVPEGSYLVDVKYQSKGTTHLEVYYAHGRNEYDLSGNVVLSSVENRRMVNITVNEADCPFFVSGRLNSECLGGDYLLFSEITISRTFASYRLGIFRLFLCMLLIDAAVYLFDRRKTFVISLERREVLTGIILTAMIATLPLMTNYLYEAQDMVFHLTRIEGLKEGLTKAGDFPVRIQPQWLNGHGYPVSIFYGDFWLYFPALLRIAGVSVQNSYKVFIALVNLATAWSAYFCFRKMSGNHRIGLAAAAVYTLNLYRLTNLYIRGAVGELTAMTFFPLILYGLWHILTEDVEKIKRDKVWMLLAFGYLGILYSHLISCEMLGLLTIFICLFRIKRVFVKERFLALLKAFSGIVVGGMWYWLPLLKYMQLDFVASKLGEFNIYRQEERGIFWAQFFSTRYDVNGGSFAIGEGMAGEMPLTLGIAFLFVLIAAIYISVCCWRAIEDKREWIMTLVLTVFFMWICTKDFPFGWLGQKIEILQLLIARLQYPWRFLGVVALLFSWLFVIILSKVHIEEKWKKTFAVIVCTVFLINSMDSMSEVMSSVKGVRIYDGGALSSFGVMGGEYMYNDFHNEDYVDDITDIGGGVIVSEWAKGGNEVRLQAVNTSAEEQTLELPVIRYEGYRAKDMQTGEELFLSDGKSHRAVLHLPGGYSGQIRVKFEEPVSWRIADLISLAGFVLAVIVVICDKQKIVTTYRKENGEEK